VAIVATGSDDAITHTHTHTERERERERERAMVLRRELTVEESIIFYHS
jgi:hypothetical protein